MNGSQQDAGSSARTGQALSVPAELPDTDSLNTSARLSLWLLAKGQRTKHSAVVTALMKAHGWTWLRAWRHWRGYSKSEVAHRLGIHLVTYELIESGSVDLGLWLQPAVEMLLQD